MKRFIAILSMSALLISCSDQKTETAATADAARSSTSLPYTASYSSDFEMGNPAYVATILQGSWKDWETNKLDNMKSWIADTVVAFHSDNMTVVGADSLIARWKRGRAEYVSVLDTVQAATAVYSKDKNENWVLVWVKEINEKVDGTKDTSYLMESWRINKDGKADMLLQYDRAKREK